MRKFRYILTLWILVFNLVLITAVFPKESSSTILFSVPKGAGAAEVAQKLADEGIVQNSLWFRILLKFHGAESKLRAGNYPLSPDYPYTRIIDILEAKEGPGTLISTTIPEGFTLAEIAFELKRTGVISDSRSFLVYAKTQAKIELENEFPFLAEIPTSNLEGYFFPETYVFAQDVSYKEIAEKFLAQFSERILPEWKKNGGKIPLHKALTMASIIEKESWDPREMSTVSGVFFNRLAKHLTLSSCPTVAYALGEPRKLTLTYEDLKVVSPYNTYRHYGLPPTPIASPGILAFRAALNPAPTPYLFFVANGDGTHRFSKTYRDHLRNQQEILRRQKSTPQH